MSAADYSPTPTESVWRAPQASGPVRGSVRVPGSKSLTNRALLLAALADAPSTLVGALASDDSRRMTAALEALGATIVPADGDSSALRVTPAPLRGDTTIDCGQAGTVMRFVAPVAGLASGDVFVTADQNALHRPMGELISALREIGVDIDDAGTWSLPFTVRGHGHIRGGEVTIDASASSQFVSGLLLAAPRFDVGLRLIHSGDRLPSLPHIDMTIDALAARGVRVERAGPAEWLVPASPIRGKDVVIEPDLSNAAPFLAAAVVTGGEVSIPDWPTHSTQPGHLLPEILRQFGARTSLRGGVLTITGPDVIRPVDLDLSAASELTPTLFGIAAFADGPSTFRGIGHIRGHETDRLAALAQNLVAVGGSAEELPDGLRVRPSVLTGGPWRAFHDHRIATTGALIGLRAPDVVVDDITTTNKTLPEFPALWNALLAGV